MKYKLLSMFCMSLIFFFTFTFQTSAIGNKENNTEMTDERAIEIIREIADFMNSGEKISDEVSCRESDGYDDYYFKNQEDEEKLYVYHRDYIKDTAYDYLCDMYDISFIEEEIHSRKNPKANSATACTIESIRKGNFI